MKPRLEAQPLDPQHLPVSHDSTCKVWVSLDASSLKVARDVDGVWLRLCGTTLCASGCPLPGPSRCAGGLLAMSVSVLVLFADGDCRPGPCMHNPGLGQVLPLFSSAFRVDLEGSQRSSSEHMPAPFSYLVRMRSRTHARVHMRVHCVVHQVKPSSAPLSAAFMRMCACRCLHMRARGRCA